MSSTVAPIVNNYGKDKVKKMKNSLILCLIIAAAMLVCPAAALGEGKPEPAKAPAREAQADGAEEYISVMASSDRSVSKVKMREYILGSVAAEMPANYHPEALKAQAVASYTYAKRLIEQNKKGKNSDLNGADITDDPATHQGYLNKSARKKLWGGNYEEYERKLGEAADEVLGIYLAYDGETALAAYHSISSGRTASAKTVWDSDIPYLIGVESPGDRLSPDYISESKFTDEEFRSLAEEAGIAVDGGSDGWIGDTETDDGGYVTSIEICGKRLGGGEFRTAFSLKSAAFEISHSGGEFTVTCKGHGHGLGMSQYGADYMARQGSSWREILAHYYPGTEIIG